MAKVRLTKEFDFEMAHALWNYDGPCRNIHGHSYKLFVTIKGEPIHDKSHSKLGMVMDFGELKKLVKKEIIDRFDHCLVINAKAPHDMMQKVDQMFEKYEVLNYQPTSENLIIDFARILQKVLPEEVELYSLRLNETATSYAEWYKSDNEG